MMPRIFRAFFKGARFGRHYGPAVEPGRPLSPFRIPANSFTLGVEFRVRFPRCAAALAAMVALSAPAFAAGTESPTPERWRPPWRRTAVRCARGEWPSPDC